MTSLLLLRLLMPSDTVLVEIFAVTTNERVTVEAIQQDSTLWLPSTALHDLLGIPPPPTPWLTVKALQAAYPMTVVRWNPREGRVLIWDDLGIFPITRRFRETHRASAFGTAPIPLYSGPYASFAADDREHHVTDVGYTWRSRLSVTGRYSSALGSAWGVTLAPSSRLYLNYSDGTGQSPTASVRFMTGPAWALANWTPERWSLDALVRVGPVSVFGSTRETFALTINAAPVGVQAGWTGHRKTVRLTYGPIPPSPFMVPTVP
jgi:hypothetical protein